MNAHEVTPGMVLRFGSYLYTVTRVRWVGRVLELHTRRANGEPGPVIVPHPNEPVTLVREDAA